MLPIRLPTVIAAAVASFAAVSLLVTPAFAAFADVSTTHQHAKAINYVQAQGIVSGYPDGAFRPDQTINRAEFVKIVVESFRSILMYSIDGMRTSAIDNCLQMHEYRPSDVSSTDWFAPHVCAAHETGFIMGYPDGTFHPSQSINFVEAAKILANAYIETESHQFDDQSEGQDWYKVYVEAMAQKNAIPISISHFAQPITRGEMAEMIYRLKAKVTDKPSKTYEQLSRRG